MADIDGGDDNVGKSDSMRYLIIEDARGNPNVASLRGLKTRAEWPGEAHLSHLSPVGAGADVEAAAEGLCRLLPASTQSI